MLRGWESVWDECGRCGKLCGCVGGGMRKCGGSMEKCVGVCGEVLKGRGVGKCVGV